MKTHLASPLNLDYIIDTVAAYYKIPREVLMYGNRERRSSEPRQVAAYCIYKFSDKSYPFIAKLFNKRTHQTIMYAVRKVSEWMDNPILNKEAVNCIQCVLKHKNLDNERL